jgi:hypothetical protein
MSDARSVLDERNEAYSRAVPHSSIQGLYPSFSTAVTILRIARSLGELEMEEEGVDEEAHLDAFYAKLSTVEQSLLESNNTRGNAKHTVENSPFVVVVEGLDGTGTLHALVSLS